MSSAQSPDDEHSVRFELRDRQALRAPVMKCSWASGPPVNKCTSRGLREKKLASDETDAASTLVWPHRGQQSKTFLRDRPLAFTPRR